MCSLEICWKRQYIEKNSIMVVLQSHLLEVLSVMTYNVVSILFNKVKMGMFISPQFAQLRLLILAYSFFFYGYFRRIFVNLPIPGDSLAS